MFIEHSLRSAMKPECISAEIERACARAAASFGQMPFSGNFSARYSMIASESQVVDRTVDEDRDLSGRRILQNALLVRGIIRVERDDHLIEADAGRLQAIHGRIDQDE